MAPGPSAPGTLGLVMGGGGARAAYQVGFLRWLAHHHRAVQIPIVTGVSAGAINAAFLAVADEPFDAAVEHLAELWEGLTPEQVFRSDSTSLLRNGARWGLRLVSGGTRLGPPTRGMVDSSPLREFLQRALRADEDGYLPGIEKNLRRRRLQAVGITTTDYATGQSMTFVESDGTAPDWRRPHRRSVQSRLTVEHVMASAALPMFFPAVQLGDSWHGDGGIRLTAPLSPALHLGAERIIAISTRHQKSQAEADRPNTNGYPPPAQVLGVLLNAIFLDMLDFDALNMSRINELVEALPEERRGNLRVAELLILRPSRDLSRLATEYEPRLPQPFKFLMRGLGTRETRSPDSLSMVMFERDYIRHMIRLGEEDAERHKGEIEEFLEGRRGPALQRTGFWRI